MLFLSLPTSVSSMPKNRKDLVPHKPCFFFSGQSLFLLKTGTRSLCCDYLANKSTLFDIVSPEAIVCNYISSSSSLSFVCVCVGDERKSCFEGMNYGCPGNSV